MPAGKADVHRSLEMLEEYHADLFRSSDVELKLAIERVINVFKHSLFNALCDIHEFYENVLLNERIPVGDKIFESRRFAARWERSPLGPFQFQTTGSFIQQPTGLSPVGIGHPPLPQPRSPSRPSSRRSYGGQAEPGSFLQTSPINRIVDEGGREWEVEEVLLDVSKTGLGFSISGGRDREPDPVYGDKYIRVTDISPGGAVQKDGRIHVSDVILRVNDWDTANCEHSYAVEALKNAGAFVRLLVKRLKPPAIQPGMHRSLSQSHLTEPTLGLGGGTFQRSYSGVAEREHRAFTTTASTNNNLQPPIRSQSLHQLPTVAQSSAPFTAVGTLPHRQQVTSQMMPPSVQFTPTQPEPGRQPRWVTLRKADHGLGFNIVGGEDGEPVYVSHVMPGGAADLNGNIRKGDVLLQVNDVNLSNATHGEAAVALKAIPIGSQVQMLLQYRPMEFRLFEDKVERTRQQQQQQQQMLLQQAGPPVYR